MVGSSPKRLSKMVGTEMVVLLRVKPYNKDFPNSSIAVVQFSKVPQLLSMFTYTNNKVVTVGVHSRHG